MHATYLVRTLLVYWHIATYKCAGIPIRRKIKNNIPLFLATIKRLNDIRLTQRSNVAHET
jgi:hypothetical protein